PPSQEPSMRAYLVSVPCLPPGARSVSLGRILEGVSHFARKKKLGRTAPMEDLIRDRDRVYAAAVIHRLRAMGIRDKPIASGSPWENRFAERLIGSICRECVDHVVVLTKGHLRRIVAKYATYYEELRTHGSLNKDAPIHRAIHHGGRIVSAPVLRGLHHHYCRI